MSEAALTDSTIAQASFAVTRLPFSGSSINTKSPSDSCAWSVIPMVTLPSASALIHSWLAVYFKSAGTFIALSRWLRNEDLPLTHERGLGHPRRELLLANLHAQRGALCNACGTRASAIELPSVGENVPLVISPT